MASNRELLKLDIERYIQNTLTEPHERLGGLPICPFAKAYYEQTLVVTPRENFTVSLKQWAALWNPKWHTCVVLGFANNKQMPTADYSEKMCDKLQAKLWNKDATVLLNHPHNPHPVANVYTGFDAGVLVIIQRTSTLDKARKSLLEKRPDYYDNWSQSDLEDL